MDFEELCGIGKHELVWVECFFGLVHSDVSVSFVLFDFTRSMNSLVIDLRDRFGNFFL